MLINSLIFWLFFALFLLPYFTLMRGSSRVQNAWLLVFILVTIGWQVFRCNSFGQLPVSGNGC